MKEVVVVVALHPDDETLGCGGTLLKHKESGDQIHWLICTEMKVEDGFSEEKIDVRNKEISKVGGMYAFDSVHRLGLSTMKVDEYSVSELVSKVSEVFQEIKPTKLYLPFKNDIHSDHRYMFDAVYSCTKIFRYPYIKSIYMMEVLSESEFSVSLNGDGFIPNVFIDTSDFHCQKKNIMEVYEGELREHPFPRSIKTIDALSILRGSTAGCKHAESFMLIKEIK
jgi:LmbE family N-acetylglucosaminyl deacetylase